MKYPIDISFDFSKIYDCVITCCGYESRAGFLCREGIQGRRCIAIDYMETGRGSVDRNREIYLDKKWELVEKHKVNELLEERVKKEHARDFCIDISSMPRELMGSIVAFFSEHYSNSISVDFVYLIAPFSQSKKAANAQGSVSLYKLSDYYEGALRDPSTPVGLMIGLGLEEKRARGIIEYFEPKTTLLYMGINGDPNFEIEEKEIHDQLIKQYGSLDYNIRSLQETFDLLFSSYESLKYDNRLILAPSGPKIFTLACLLLASTRETTRPAVWRVGGKPGGAGVDVEATGDIISARVVF